MAETDDEKAYREMEAWLDDIAETFSVPRRPDDFSGIGPLPSSQNPLPPSERQPPKTWLKPKERKLR